MKNDNMSYLEDDSWNPLPVEIYITAGSEGAVRNVTLPKRFRDRMDLIPEDLCITKEVDWMSSIRFQSEKLGDILSFLYQQEIEAEYLVDLKEKLNSDILELIGYWD